MEESLDVPRVAEETVGEMIGAVDAVQQYEARPAGSPVRVKADPNLVSDVMVSCSTPTQSVNTGKTHIDENISLDSVLVDVPEEDEEGEVFDRYVADLLIAMNMRQYLTLFKEADVGFNLFLTLTEDDLEVIGIANQTHRKDIAHGIANVKKKRCGPTRGLRDDVLDVTVCVEEALPIMCHTLKHINNLVLLLRNYRIRLNSNQVRNRLMDTHQSAAYGAKILTKEAIAQSELLKIQLHGMLHKIDPYVSKETSIRKGKASSSKSSKLLTKSLLGGMLITAASISLMLSLVLRRRLA